MHVIGEYFYCRIFYEEDGDQEDIKISELESLRGETEKDSGTGYVPSAVVDSILLSGASAESVQQAACTVSEVRKCRSFESVADDYVKIRGIAGSTQSTRLDELGKVEHEPSDIRSELLSNVEQENVTEQTDTSSNGYFLGLAPVKKGFLSYAALVYFCFAVCLLKWYLCLEYSSPFFAAFKNCNLRGRLEHCSLFQISIFNSQPTFATIPTNQQTYNSTFQSNFYHSHLWGKTTKPPSFTISIFPLVCAFTQQLFRKQLMGKFVSCFSSCCLLIFAESLAADIRGSFGVFVSHFLLLELGYKIAGKL